MIEIAPLVLRLAGCTRYNTFKLLMVVNVMILRFVMITVVMYWIANKIRIFEFAVCEYIKGMP